MSGCRSWRKRPGTNPWSLREVCAREPGHAPPHQSFNGWHWTDGDREPRPPAEPGGLAEQAGP